jgi:peptide/nickel transport system permease protein
MALPRLAGGLARAGGILLGLLGRVVPTLLIVVVLSFFLLRLAPGDAADVIAAQSGAATAETMVHLRSQLGLDLPVLVQFAQYVGGLAHLDLGLSTRFGIPVLDVILGRLPYTIVLMVAAIVLALVLGIAAGVGMAARPGSPADRILSAVVLLFYSVPSFWGALMLIVVFSVKLGWLPSSGHETIGMTGGPLALGLDRLRFLVLPAVSLATFFIAIYARLTRASMLEVAHQDFVRTARAKGLSSLQVTLHHVLRNALIPVTTLAGVHFGVLLGGAVVVETVFGWPGLGSLAIGAVLARDYNVLLGLLLFSSLLVVLVNIGVDLLHGWLDPRISAGRR